MSENPSELSADAVRSFIISRGGKVTNQQLVKNFKVFLTDPNNKNEARSEFKSIVNQIANVIKDDNGEKYLTLKKSSRPSGGNSPVLSITSSIGNEPSPSPSPTFAKYCSPPPYREPPPVSSPTSSIQYCGTAGNKTRNGDDTPIKSPPTVPPRRKSSEKIKEEMGGGAVDGTLEVDFCKDANKKESNNSDSSGQEQFSVKECMKKFHRLASQDSTPPKAYQPMMISNSTIARKRITDKNASDRDDDTDSTNSLDQRYKDWIVRAARGDYHELAKLASENHKLAKYKDPATTALHWGAKHGNTDIVKLIAGTYGVNVNQRTGYTPLHIAMQFGNEDVYNLLVDVYGADQNLRDWSGRKPRQYQMKNTTVSSDTFRSNAEPSYGCAQNKVCKVTVMLFFYVTYALFTFVDVN